MLTAVVALMGLAIGASVATALLMLRSGSRVHVAEREAETLRKSAVVSGSPHPTRDVADAIGVEPATAAKHVMKAREAKLLPPTSPGKAQA